MRRPATDTDQPATSNSPSSRPATDGGLGDVLRRAIEAGAKNLSGESIRHLLAEMRLPKDALVQLLSQSLHAQLVETKESVYRSVSRELRDVLERVNLSDEIASALSKVSVEVSMQVKFKPQSTPEAAKQSPAQDSTQPAAANFTTPGTTSPHSQTPTPPEKKSQ